MKKKKYENYKNLNKTMNIKMLISFILGIIISITSSYALAETLIKSADVSYVDNSNLKATNVQSAIDGTCTKFSNELSNFLNKIYPVGSIYISTANTNPSTFLGGTWENYADGRVLKGIKSGTAGTTGGSSSVTLSTSNLPAHTHDISHTHTTTSIQVSGTTDQGIVSMSGFYYKAGNNLPSGTWDISAGVSDVISQYDQNSGGLGMGLNHVHNITMTIPKLTTEDTKITSGSAGSSNPTAINVQDPYITVYMWRRTK